MSVATRVVRIPAVRLAFLALVALAFFLSYGNSVSHAQAGGVFDDAARRLAGHGLLLALFLTGAGRFPVFAVLCVALLIFGFVRRRYLGVVAVPVAALIVAWKVSDFFKDLFARPRPEYWIAIRETSASYPSGHAVLALTFYGLLAYIVWRVRPPSPQRTLLLWLAGLWIVATGWSRLALGAHYVSDVVGGYLLGACFVLLGSIAIDRLALSTKAAT